MIDNIYSIKTIWSYIKNDYPIVQFGVTISISIL